MSKRRFSSTQKSIPNDEADSFYTNIPQTSKYLQLEPKTVSIDDSAIVCDLPPHDPVSFHTLEDYEVHYLQAHVNRCQECDKNFPSEHFLYLHIAECHDPMRSIKRERGDATFSCLIEQCEKVFLTEYDRRQHALAQHRLPVEYDFSIIKDGIEGKTSLMT